MGTNYYKGDVHLGKRSAAGFYCFECEITLCKDGRDKVHNNSAWHEQCPVCGAKPEKEDFGSSSVGRELGFNKNKQKKTNVRSCASFRWAIEPAMIKTITGTIRNEYGDKFTEKQFKAVVNDCPIQYFDTIGQEFS
jgi:predicted nucleic acid-binding Zn ribbon protein